MNTPCPHFLVHFGWFPGEWTAHVKGTPKMNSASARIGYARSPESFLSRIDATVAAIDDDGYRYDVRLFNPGTNTVKPSALRLVNPGDATADVIIRAHDDQGDDAPEGEVTLSVAAGTAVELSAQALERGGAGFQGRLGDGAGKWRLTVRSERFLHVLSLVRGRGGYLASLSR